MLFNSYEFIFVFLPLVVLGFWLLLNLGREAVIAWLVACSLFYYGWWNPAYVPLLVFSVLANYFLGGRIAAERSRLLLAFGVALHLGLIGYFKYLGFFAGIASALAGGEFSVGKIILPLGISFFTFQQIAYLVDSFRRVSDEDGIYSWWDYRRLGFPRNDGLRIDLVAVTESLAARCTKVWVERNERKKGKVGKPSDHAPVIAEFELEGGAE